MLTELLQVTTGINDIMFRTMDVVLICGGLISVLSAYFIQQSKSRENQREIESLNKRIDQLEKDWEKHEENIGGFKKEIFEKFDKASDRMHELALAMEGLKQELQKNRK